ncbi:MAG: protoheme IX farnesyltransferase [Phycisphaerae bacterium]
MSTIDVKTLPAVLPRARARWSDYGELLKARLVSLVLVTTAVGFLMGYLGPYDGVFWVGMLRTVLGTALVAGGAMALNQYLERRTDALMARTRARPLPEGRIAPPEALVFGTVLSLCGIGYLCASVNVLTGALAGLTSATYLLLYTPLKTRTPLCTLVGAVSGAIPPMMGYTAAAGLVTAEAWLLFAILFVWQMPHFLAIAWLYQEDYAAGRQMMLPVVDPSGTATARQMVSFSLTLLPVTLMPTVVGMTGTVYFFAALVLGLAFLAFAVRVAVTRTKPAARAMFLASVLYLPALLMMMMLDRGY